jgi:L-lactate utilization protein LutB
MAFDAPHAIKQLESNFSKRNIEVLWFATFEDAKTYLLGKIPSDATIGIGHSQTLQAIGITEAFQKRGNTVYDKELGATREETRLLKRSSLLAEYYISGSNAVSIDGRIVNIDHSGNRVAALAYGPDKVFIVVGKNKITVTCDEAIKRAKNIASPQNAKRAGYNPPCTVTGYCSDCLSSERVCNVVSVIEGQHIKGRITLLIANEDAGY